MALHKPTSGSYRLNSTSLSLAAGPRTLCAWVKWDSFDATSALFDDRQTGAGGGGCLWCIMDNPADTTKVALHYIDTVGGIRRIAEPHNTSTDVWTFWSIKIAGTATPAYTIRNNTTQASGTGINTPGTASSTIGLFTTASRRICLRSNYVRFSLV